MSYTVTYLDGHGAEISTFIDADSVERDAHWVSFTKTPKQDPRPPDPICACGGVRPMMRTSLRHKQIVALYPTQRVRAIVLTTQSDT